MVIIILPLLVWFFFYFPQLIIPSSFNIIVCSQTLFFLLNSFSPFFPSWMHTHPSQQPQDTQTYPYIFSPNSLRWVLCGPVRYWHVTDKWLQVNLTKGLAAKGLRTKERLWRTQKWRELSGLLYLPPQLLRATFIHFWKLDQSCMQVKQSQVHSTFFISYNPPASTLNIYNSYQQVTTQLEFADNKELKTPFLKNDRLSTGLWLYYS